MLTYSMGTIGGLMITNKIFTAGDLSPKNSVKHSTFKTTTENWGPPACASLAGFQHRSKWITWLAVVRFKPTPPACQGGFHEICTVFCLLFQPVPSLQSKDQNSTLWIRGEVIQSLEDLKSWNKTTMKLTESCQTQISTEKKWLPSASHPSWDHHDTVKACQKIIYTKLISQPTDPFVENFSVCFWCLNPEKCWTKSWAKSCWVSRYCLSCNG